MNETNCEWNNQKMVIIKLSFNFKISNAIKKNLIKKCDNIDVRRLP